MHTQQTDLRLYYKFRNSLILRNSLKMITKGDGDIKNCIEVKHTYSFFVLF